MDYLLFLQTCGGRNATAACHVASARLNVGDGLFTSTTVGIRGSGCSFFTLPHLHLPLSAYPDRSGLSSVTWRYSSDIIELKIFGHMLSFLNYILEYR